MTTLISWVGIDQRRPASIYFAADSRFTWDKRTRWDFGRKLFASRTRPEILGYCGDVLFASHCIGQVLERIEVDLLFSPSATIETRLLTIQEFLSNALNSYPKSQRRRFNVLYAFRNDDVEPFFCVGEISWSQENGWSHKRHSLPSQSAIVVALGSGAEKFDTSHQNWKKSECGRTSRAVYSAFCDHLRSKSDPESGGAPQLAGLYLRGTAITFGTVFAAIRWISGASVPSSGKLQDVEWRDELFQRCDGRTLLPILGAKRHSRPRSA